MIPVVLALIPVLRAVITTASSPEAARAWHVIEAALRGERDPTPTEWALLNALADAHHRTIQDATTQAPSPHIVPTDDTLD